MVHLRNWTIVDEKGSRMKRSVKENETPQVPSYKTQVRDLISQRSLRSIQANFNQLMRSTNYTAFKQLPVTNHYLPMFTQCYNTMFYNVGRHPTSCPGPMKCKLPAISGLRCSVAKSEYRHASLSWRTKLYLQEHRDNQFVTSENGCTT
ncbi:glycosyltransferase family 92 protein F59C6.8 [Ditylenchus destructor]|uniref:Glycosyltransferase family 92 protein F59C6.8 n=1 Tax=Ditylenchus destructor TaxID=166010 RepID=A0AAD4MY80_9BILA|nr:glycosyltransferase family 92 protein F59C6.8 [Ditylenchus destructor]